MVNYNAFWLILVNCSSELGSSYPPRSRQAAVCAPSGPIAGWLLWLSLQNKTTVRSTHTFILEIKSLTRLLRVYYRPES